MKEPEPWRGDEHPETNDEPGQWLTTTPNFPLTPDDDAWRGIPNDDPRELPDEECWATPLYQMWRARLADEAT